MNISQSKTFKKLYENCPLLEMWLPILNENDVDFEMNVMHAGIVNTVILHLSKDILNYEKVPDKYHSLLKNSPLAIGPFTTQIEPALEWLNAGAQYVIFTLDNNACDETLTLLLNVIKECPKERVWLSLPWTDTEDMSLFLSPFIQHVNGIVLNMTQYENENDEILEKIKIMKKDHAEDITWMVQFDKNVTSEMIGFYHKTLTMDILSPFITTSTLGDCFTACLTTDRTDGLYTTVVTDTSGVALGLVYSSKESLKMAIKEKKGIYYSRSRQNIWKKGETSGHVQTLSSIGMDCDSDAIRVTVTSAGPFCHLNTTGCWGNSKGVLKLQETLKERLMTATPGSYTQRLFTDTTLLHHKLVEEAQELSEAIDVEHVAEEAADLLYFAMVKCASSGVEWKDVERVLDHRTLKVKRRVGNAKAYRIAAATKLLSKDQ